MDRHGARAKAIYLDPNNIGSPPPQPATRNPQPAISSKAMTSESDPPATKPSPPPQPASNDEPSGVPPIVAAADGSNYDDECILSASRIERRRAFTRTHNARRDAYRNATSFRTFPLQAMAMDDFDGLTSAAMMRDCSNGDASKETTTDDVASSSSAPDAVDADSATGGDASDVAADGGGTPLVAQEDESTVRPKKAHPGECEGETEGRGRSSDAEDRTPPIVIDIREPAHDTENRVSNGTTPSQPSQSPPSQTSALWSHEPRMFAMETAIRGKRRYVSAHLGRSMDHYWRERDGCNRHHYELIREGAPCRLYFGECVVVVCDTCVICRDLLLCRDVCCAGERSTAKRH